MCYSNAPRRSPTPGTRCQSWALCLPRLGACQGPTMAPRPGQSCTPSASVVPCGSPAEPSVIQIRWSRSHEELLDPVRLVPAQEVPCWAGPAEHINPPTPIPHPHTPFSTSGSESQTGSDMSTRLPLSSRGAISYFPTQVCHRSSQCENKDRHFALLIIFKRCDL
ncbi:unnamed protein product [Boreogadus saida]